MIDSRRPRKLARSVSEWSDDLPEASPVGATTDRGRKVPAGTWLISHCTSFWSTRLVFPCSCHFSNEKKMGKKTFRDANETSQCLLLRNSPGNKPQDFALSAGSALCPVCSVGLRSDPACPLAMTAWAPGPSSLLTSGNSNPFFHHEIIPFGLAEWFLKWEQCWRPTAVSL